MNAVGLAKQLHLLPPDGVAAEGTAGIVETSVDA